VTTARVLLTLSGFVSVVNGVVELGPRAGPALVPVGIALVVVGLVTWALVWRLRRPGGRPVPLTAALTVAVAAARVPQWVAGQSPVVLLAIVLPAVAFWRVARTRREPAPGRAVPVTAGVLVVVTAAALALALAPTDLPASAAASGLNSDQSPTTPPEPPPTGHLTATDGTDLAYYADVPVDPVATLVFYHGSGANSGAGYLDFGRQVAERYHVATYLFDMRGHGRSGGPRGDAPSEAQMFADTQTAVDFVKRSNPELPEFVGGHSAGAGLVLNSEDRIGQEVAGYVYLAPDFGLDSGTEKQSDAANFATISHRPLIADVLTNGLLDAHTYAVAFAYSPDEIDRAGLVSRYTTTMAIAQNADDSARILAGTHKPVGVWIGSDDEVFSADEVLAWARNAPQATAAVVPGADHLGVIDRGVADVGTWLDQRAAAVAG
jgi:alpha-beta hydrolase superfamily lysophospholipase